MKPSICLLFLSVSLLLFFSACKKENLIEDTPILKEEKAYPNVPKTIWIYFQRFEEAAEKQGIAIDLNAQNISAEIMEITEDGVAGTCSYGSHQPEHIVIDKTFWKETSDLFKEMIVFHELGHCSLFLGHREEVNADGTCASIMRSGLGDCRDNYRVSTRESYWEELFKRVK